MADKTVRYVAGNFVDPNIDSTKQVPNIDADVNAKSVTSGVVFTQLVGQAKNTLVQVATRRAERAGNVSQADKINTLISLSGDAAALGTGFLAGGFVGLGIAGVGIGVRYALQEDNRQYELALSDLEARELARRQGRQVDDRSKYR